MSLNAELMAAIGQAQGNRAKVKRRIATMMQRTRVARSLFLTPEGALTDDAVKLFGDLARQAGMNRRGFLPDAELRLFQDGARSLLLYMIDMLALDADKLTDLQRRLEEK